MFSAKPAIYLQHKTKEWAPPTPYKEVKIYLAENHG